eukprot:6225103-Karenia_brevis.AAC.1
MKNFKIAIQVSILIHVKCKDQSSDRKGVRLVCPKMIVTFASSLVHLKSFGVLDPLVALAVLALAPL